MIAEETRRQLLAGGWSEEKISACEARRAGYANAQPNGTILYMELTGAWGWTCDLCRAESRYTYGDRHDARRLALRHLCPGARAVRDHARSRS